MNHSIVAGLLGLVMSLPAVRSAEACSRIIGLVGVQPQEGTTLPGNGEVFFTLSPDRIQVEAWLLPENTDERIPAPVERIGPTAGRVRLPRDLPLFGVELSVVGRADSRTVPVLRSDVDDLQPPPAPTELSVDWTWQAQDMCFGQAGFLNARFTASGDDLRVAGYVLYELIGRAFVPVAAAVEREPQVSAGSPRAIFGVENVVEPAPGTERCFMVRARDLSGAESAPSPTACVTYGQVADAGVGDTGTFDLGTISDAGEVDSGFMGASDAGSFDAGPPSAPDAGSGGTLEPAEPGCGCQSAGSGHPLGVLWLALWGLVFAVRSGRRRSGSPS